METEEHKRPRFRTDLVAQPIEEKGQVFVDVTDPDSGTTFRFYEVEYSVACAMDGERNVGALKDWARAELGIEPAPEELQTVISTLDELGYLEPPGAAPDMTPAGGAELPRGAAVVPGGSPAPAGGDVELGEPGKSPGARPQAAAPSSGDVELGHAGGAQSARAAVPVTSSPAPSGDETSFEGLMEEDAGTEESRAGTQPWLRGQDGDDVPNRPGVMELEADEPPPEPKKRSLREAAHAGDDEDGPTNIPPPVSDFDEDEVSVDLSEHLSIGTDDVKEAVRQSRTIQAVSPGDDAEDGEETRVKGPSRERPAEAGAAADAGAAPAARAPEPAPRPVEPVPATAEPIEPPAAAAGEPGKGGSSLVPLLVALLVVAIGSGAAYYYLNYMRGAADGGAEPAQPAVSAAPEEPEPEPPTTTLAPDEVEPVEVAAENGGEVSWVIEPGSEVASGDAIVKFNGYGSFEEAIAYYESRRSHYQDKLDKATAAGQKGRMERAQAKVEEKEERLTKARGNLAKHMVAAPRAGLVEPAVSEDDDVAKGDVVAQIVVDPGTQGRFEVDDASGFSEGQEVRVTAERSGETATCEVTAVEVAGVTVTCAPESPLAAGDVVVLDN